IYLEEMGSLFGRNRYGVDIMAMPFANKSVPFLDLADLRTMRNASAHLTSTTQAALESLAQRIFSTPRPGIDLYTMLTSVDPASASGNTVFAERKDLLLIAAKLIAS